MADTARFAKRHTRITAMEKDYSKVLCSALVAARSGYTVKLRPGVPLTHGSWWQQLRESCARGTQWLEETGSQLSFPLLVQL